MSKLVKEALGRDDEGGRVSFVPPPPISALKRVGVDLDGTLAEGVWTPENPCRDIGEPIERNVRKVLDLVRCGYKIWIHTSRSDTDYEMIEAWLTFHDIPFHGIICGKPLFVLYVDDRGRHESAESWLPESPERTMSDFLPRWLH